MGHASKDCLPLLQAIESGLWMQLEWGAPMAVLQAGGLQAHVVEESPGEYRWCLEQSDRFAPPIAEGVSRKRMGAVSAAARAFLEGLAVTREAVRADRVVRRRSLRRRPTDVTKAWAERRL